MASYFLLAMRSKRRLFLLKMLRQSSSLRSFFVGARVLIASAVATQTIGGPPSLRPGHDTLLLETRGWSLSSNSSGIRPPNEPCLADLDTFPRRAQPCRACDAVASRDCVVPRSDASGLPPDRGR